MENGGVFLVTFWKVVVAGVQENVFIRNAQPEDLMVMSQRKDIIR